MLEMVELEHALNLVLSLTQSTAVETVVLREAGERILAERISAVLDIPPFDRSPLDGYAIRGEDTGGALPVDLRLLGEAPAGSMFPGVVSAGEAVRILTGSPLPRGANCVIRQEDTEEQSGYVRVFTRLVPGSNISKRGEDICRGEELLPPGSQVTPAVCGILASQGMDKLKVFARPRVALASTGDELAEVGKALQAGQIYNTNLYSLSALVETWGGQVVNLGVVKDRVEDLAKIIDLGLEQADLVITTGGASVGTYDVTVRAMQKAGVEMLFWRVAMKPGTPMVCGIKQGKLVIGLSGNPAAAFISASLIAAPVVRKMAGQTAYNPKRVKALSLDSFAKKSGVRRLIRARVEAAETGFTASFPSLQQPGVLKSMLNTNALVDLAPGETLAAGQTCSAFLMEEWI